MDEPKPRLRWFQFSLRTVLVFVTLCAIPCSWLAVKLKNARDEHEAADFVRKLGGAVRYNYDVDAAGHWIPNAKPQTPAWLRQILGADPFSYVVALSVDCDTQLEQLSRFPKLRAIRVDCSSTMTDSGLSLLQDAPKLRELEIGVEKQFTDASLSNLRRLTKLEKLDIQYLQITDAGLRHLQGLTELQELIVGGRVTDSGLVYLKAMTQLRSLTIGSESVTAQGLKDLQRALPNCKIDY